MKKLLFAFASLALLTSANAQEGADVKWNAEARFRFTNVENAGGTESANNNQTVQRTKLGATMTKGEDLTATVTLINAATWGTLPTGNLTPGNTDNDLMVYEAFVFWKAMDNFALKIGRGALDLADGTVVARNDWEQTPYTFEGVYGAYFTEWANIGLFGVKGAEEGDATNTTAGYAADINFYGVSLDFKNLPEWLKMANFHAMQSNATNLPSTTGNAMDKKLRMGVTVKGDTAGVDYRATYAMYTGETNFAGAGNANAAAAADHEASMMDAEVGYTLPDVMNLRISALYHTDSGQDGSNKNTEYDPFFYDRHNNAGLMDIMTWGNLTYMKVGVALEPMEMTRVGADYYMFEATEGTDLGTEIDVWAVRTLSNGVELNARLGMFDWEDTATNPETEMQASLGATFRF